MSSNSNNNDRKYKGVRRRKWGKWVSEIRVPGTQERLWLGSYSSAEAAAVAHDVAYYCLRRPTNMEQLNIPSMMLQITNNLNIIREDMSPCSIQKAASDAAMAVDAHYISSATTTANQDYSSWGTDQPQPQQQQQQQEEAFSYISIEDYL